MKPTTFSRCSWKLLLSLLLLALPAAWSSNELQLLADSAVAGSKDSSSGEEKAGTAQESKSADKLTAKPSNVKESVPVAEPFSPRPGAPVNFNDLVDFNLDLGLHFNFTAGVAYDSNTLLADNRVAGVDHGGLPVVGEWVEWWNVGLSFDGGSGADGDLLGPYYGFDVNGSIFAYSSGRGEAGRDNVEPTIRGYIGDRGSKTDIRFDAAYRIQKGNTVDFADMDREARRAQQNEWTFGVTMLRMLPHGSLRGAVASGRNDFVGSSHLNDVDNFTWDAAWFNDPFWADKTSFGIGLRGGQYNSDRNLSQTYLEPSLRVIYDYSAKTNFFGNVGYSFRNFDGPGAINDAGSTSFELGMNWAVTRATSAHLAAYRTFHPSFVTAFEDYNVTGFRLGADHALPRDFTLGVETAYENADYFSTIQAADASRADEYWRVGTTLSHPINLTRRFPGTISAFFYWNENQSSDNRFGFDQYFTGVRVNVSTSLGTLGR